MNMYDVAALNFISNCFIIFYLLKSFKLFNFFFISDTFSCKSKILLFSAEDVQQAVKREVTYPSFACEIGESYVVDRSQDDLQ